MARKREWRGCVTVHRGILHLKVPDRSTKSGWAERSLQLEDTPANRRAADRKLAEVRDQLLAREAALGGTPGPATVRAWAKRWLDGRRGAGIADVVNDEQRLRDHVLPAIGDLRLEDVRPRHLVAIVDALKKGHAPRTVRNVYYLTKAMFRDAEIAELVPLGQGPCILTKRQLGKLHDAKPGWRPTARFSRAELEVLLSSDQVPEDRRVWYGLLALGMLRTGEAAGLRWRALEEAEPLDRLDVWTSYDDGQTKTQAERWMPVHPTLGALLAGWKLGGWARAFGQPPGPDDLVCPVVAEKRPGRHRATGSMRDKNFAWKRIARDLRKLGLRHRRAHDLRRTGISLAREDGVDREILRWGTHAPPRDVMSLYTSHDWETLCREVAKLRVERRPGARVVELGPHHVGEKGSPVGVEGHGERPRVRKKGR